MFALRRVAAALLLSVPALVVGQEECPAVVSLGWSLYKHEPRPWYSVRTRSNAFGWLAYWYGPPDANGVKPLAFAFVTHERASAAYLNGVITDVATIGASAAMKLRQTLSVDDLEARRIWCPFWPEMNAGRKH